MSKLKKHNIFLEEIKLHHPELKVLGTYINSQTKILLEDNFGIQYLFRPNDLLKGSKPSINSSVNKNLAFKIKAEQIHGEKTYDYSQVNYITNRDKVKIVCNKCNLAFLQRPTRHLSGDGCPQCGFVKSQISNQQILNQRAISIVKDIFLKHNNKINCDKLLYKGNKAKAIFGCNVKPEHGYWMATPNDILDGCGCPLCNSSKGELEVESILIEKNIFFIKNKTFTGCKHKSLLKFDFYLPKYNICIEYDGLQHFKPISFFGGNEQLKENKKRDKIKNKFCKNNGIFLIRIPYTEFNEIRYILSSLLNL